MQEACRGDAYFKFIDGIQSWSPIVRLFSYEVALAQAGLATLETCRADAYFKFIEGFQSWSPIVRLFSHQVALA